MKINKSIIAKLSPCKDRFDNYKKHYKAQSFTVKQFLSLDEITYGDKVWVMMRLMSHKQNVMWALACADSVRELVKPEHKVACDKALETAELWLNGKATVEECKVAAAAANTAANAWYAADAAAYAWYAAYAAANAADAAYAAANTAHFAAAAADATAYAADAAWYAAYANGKQQEDLNLLLIIEVLNLKQL